ncbi:hypothetical protein [Micromonospora robiginosa]|uniref:dTDP-4-amino-4,6-dideoxygalactose transaminase n=1 Tax=Micromonospora robiginosa TaxID=2749844 RepID=A0A7L6AZK3_9ACTN|nr:hypothetical protein [Micromonospora ferruginea]QLQ35064.1 hypothetical protein H1D33_16725 [Micromonospora ferruginea]
MPGDRHLRARPRTDPDDRWEVGSSFPLTHAAGPGTTRLPSPLRLYGTGRQALLALLRMGRTELGWTAVHLPAYYCPPVADAAATVLPVRRYDAGPRGHVDPPRPGPTEAVVAVSYFGDRPADPVTRGAALVVDSTHDPFAPWLPSTGADYVLAALRKTLPLPDGAALWSPAGHHLPAQPAPSVRHRAAAGQVLAAMCLKATYLSGSPVEKNAFLSAFAAGEAAYGSTSVSGASDYTREALPAMPVDRWRRQRTANAVVLGDALAGVVGLRAHVHPFGVVVECDSGELREALRTALVARRVYPAVLWPQPPDAPARHLDYSRRMLHLHTDHRWRAEDMLRVAARIHDVLAPVTGPTPDPTDTREVMEC